MWPLDIPLDTEVGPVATTEHAYQMAKFEDETVKRAIGRAATGIQAKRIANKFKFDGVPVIDGWREDRIAIMGSLVRKKFTTNPNLAKKLLETGDAPIEEGNRWGDTFWGISPPNSGIGENNLGKLIMTIREELRTPLVETAG